MRECNCADPENCREVPPGYVCRRTSKPTPTLTPADLMALREPLLALWKDVREARSQIERKQLPTSDDFWQLRRVADWQRRLIEQIQRVDALLSRLRAGQEQEQKRH